MTHENLPENQVTSLEVEAAYERVLADTSVGSNFIEAGGGRRIHLLERGDGPPLVLLHGTTAAAGFFVPLLNELDGVRALAPDRPGHGLSDPIELPRDRFRGAVVDWLDQFLDTLNVDAPRCSATPEAGSGRCGTHSRAPSASSGSCSSHPPPCREPAARCRSG